MQKSPSGEKSNAAEQRSEQTPLLAHGDKESEYYEKDLEPPLHPIAEKSSSKFNKRKTQLFKQSEKMDSSSIMNSPVKIRKGEYTNEDTSCASTVRRKKTLRKAMTKRKGGFGDQDQIEQYIKDVVIPKLKEDIIADVGSRITSCFNTQEEQHTLIQKLNVSITHIEELLVDFNTMDLRKRFDAF